MNQSKDNLSIYSKRDVEELLQKLKSGNNKCNLTFYLSTYTGSILKNSIIKSINIEIKKRSIDSLKFYFFLKKTLFLLKCFVDICPETLDFITADTSEELNLNDCSKLFDMFRAIKPVNFIFEVHIERVGKGFVERFTEEIENISFILNFCNIYIKNVKHIHEKVIDSFKVLNSFAKFNYLVLTLDAIKCPIQFGSKLAYLKVKEIYFSLSEHNISLAHQIAMKSLAETCVIGFDKLKKIKPMMPLFVTLSNSLNKKLQLMTAPQEKINRVEFKAALKYFFFNDFGNDGLSYKFPLSSEENKFLQENKRSYVS